MNRRLWALLALVCALTWSAQWHWAQTIDEPQHLWAGVRILQQGDVTRFDNSKMPVSVLNAAGWLLSQAPGVQGSWFWARFPQVVWLVGTVLVVFAWARRAHGDAAALWASALVGLDPNLVAHAGLVTTDLPCTFGVLLACFAWVRMLEQDSWSSSVWAGAAVGAAQLAKFTALFLGPILGLVTLFWCFASRSWAPFRKLPVAILAGLFALNLGYGFSGTLTPASEIRWKSGWFAPLADANVPIPVPRPWIEGVDWVKHDDDAGQGRVYASGERTHFGRPDHYLRTLPRKFPIPLMVLGALGLWAMVRRKELTAASVSEVVAPVFLLGWFSFAFNSQVGSRYVLPVVPFLALLAARVPVRWTALGVGWTLVSGITWWPWGLSYFNESVTDRSQAWRIVADSDLDWGQSDSAAAAWLVQHPDGLYNPDVPAPGPVLLGANRLTGVMGHPSRMACYREHLVPAETLAGGLYPLEFSAQDFEPCFPVVEWSGGGTDHPAGEHLLIVRGAGRLELTVAGRAFESTTEDEGILGVVVMAATPFDADWRVPQTGSVYLNGALIDGVAPAE